MPSPDFKKNLMKIKSLRIAKEARVIKKRRWSRRIQYILFSLLFPLFLPIHVILMVVYGVFRGAVSGLVYRYIRFYFSIYYAFRGVKSLYFNKVDQSEPELIFTTRAIELHSPFLTTVFSDRVVLPVSSYLYRYPLTFLFPFITFGLFMNVLGYPDNPIEEMAEEIVSLYDQGHRVIVYINPQYANPQFIDDLFFYKEVLDLLDSDMKCSFLHCAGLEISRVATVLRPQLVDINYVSKETLFEGVEEKNHVEKVKKIVDFFQCKAGRFV